MDAQEGPGREPRLTPRRRRRRPRHGQQRLGSVPSVVLAVAGEALYPLFLSECYAAAGRCLGVEKIHPFLCDWICRSYICSQAAATLFSRFQAYI
jgi:hypothetical protein